jgi:heme exporter protein A
MRECSGLEDGCVDGEGARREADTDPEPMWWAPDDAKAQATCADLPDGVESPFGHGLSPVGLGAAGLASFRAERLVFAGVGLTVGAGEALILVGPNGSGKSTLMRLLAGLKQPDAGTVFWDERPVADDLVAHARRVAYVGHLDGIKPGLSARENLAFAATVGGGDVDQALAGFGLSSYAAFPARMLSAGQRRRLALARLTLKRAPLWLLDEPTVGLDTASIGLFGEMLGEHLARGGVVVAATHVRLPLLGAKTLGLA